MDKNNTAIVVNVDKVVVKITGLSIKGLKTNELEKILQAKLKTMTRIIGVTGSTIDMDVYGIEEEDILRNEQGLIEAVSLADGIKATDVVQVASVNKIRSVDFAEIPAYESGQCAGERWGWFND